MRFTGVAVITIRCEFDLGLFQTAITRCQSFPEPLIVTCIPGCPAGSPFRAQQESVAWWPRFKLQLERMGAALVAVLRWVPALRRLVPADAAGNGGMRRTGSDLFDRQSGWLLTGAGT